MTGLLFYDTNILIYGLDPRETWKRTTAADLTDRGIRSERLVTSPQSLNECYRVLARRQLVPSEAARRFVQSLFATCSAPLDTDSIAFAWALESETGFAWWDCLLLSSAVLAGCSHFLTEDLSDGRDVRGMTLVNPFQHDISSLLS